MVGRQVLVIDDDEDVLTLLERILESEGYDVVTAEDGLVALDKLAQRKPDLILLDLMMPRMDGYTFANELTRRELRPAIPIVVLSADVNAQSRVRQMGIERFLAKPFDLSVLLDTVSEFISSHQPPQEPQIAVS